MENPKPKTYAVIQTAFLGDIALTSSFLRDLRSLHPQAKIIFVTTPAGIELLRDNPWDIELLPFAKRGVDAGPRGLWRKANILRAKKINRVYCLHRSARSVLLARFSGAPERIGFLEAAMSWLFTKKISRADYQFEAQKNRALLLSCESKGTILPEPFPVLYCSEQETWQAEQLLQSLGQKPFVAMATSSVWATKRWPAERFGAVAAHLWKCKQMPIVFLGAGDAADTDCTDRAIAAFRALVPADEFAEAHLNLNGQTKLGVLKAVLKRTKVLLCNDSAPLHIAIAKDTAVVAIFGPTTRSLGFFPFAKDGMSAVIEHPHLECRPCGKHGHHRCPLKHFRCMLDLDTQRVIETLEPFL
jgi:heptosyltransferase II